MQYTLPFWQPVHKVLVKNQKLIQHCLLLLAGLVALTIPLGFYFFSTNKAVFASIASVADTIGSIALYLFLLTLLPGILQRFKVFPLLSASIVLFRRQIGILMFLVAAMHSMYISTIVAISTGNVGPESLPPNGLAGMVTMLVLLPVWLTSNDISQKKLGKFWKSLQRLTYVALFVIFFHVALVERSAALLIALVFSLEVLSWIWKKYKSKKPVNQQN